MPILDFPRAYIKCMYRAGLALNVDGADALTEQAAIDYAYSANKTTFDLDPFWENNGNR